VGIKPTLGLVSRTGIVPISPAQDTAGPMARSVADAAALLSVLAATDPGDPACSDAQRQAELPDGAPDYHGFCDPDALRGARVGVWRDGSAAAGAPTAAVLDSAVTRLRELGATVIDPVELPGADKIGEPESAALLHEFKHSLGAYLAAVPGNVPRTLAEMISFNQRNAELVLARFGQDLFARAEAARGGAGDPAYLELRADAARLARVAVETPLVTHRLDAIVALTANPACMTDYVLGDHDVFHTSTPAAVGGYPAVSLPFGYVWGLPVGLSFMGPRWSEPRLIALAYAFEQAATAPSATAPSAAGVPPHVTTGSPPHLAETLSP
jgi:amidase